MSAERGQLLRFFLHLLIIIGVAVVLLLQETCLLGHYVDQVKPTIAAVISTHYRRVLVEWGRTIKVLESLAYHYYCIGRLVEEEECCWRVMYATREIN